MHRRPSKVSSKDGVADTNTFLANAPSQQIPSIVLNPNQPHGNVMANAHSQSPPPIDQISSSTFMPGLVGVGHVSGISSPVGSTVNPLPNDYYRKQISTSPAHPHPASHAHSHSASYPSGHALPHAQSLAPSQPHPQPAGGMPPSLHHLPQIAFQATAARQNMLQSSSADAITGSGSPYPQEVAVSVPSTYSQSYGPGTTPLRRFFPGSKIPHSPQRGQVDDKTPAYDDAHVNVQRKSDLSASPMEAKTSVQPALFAPPASQGISGPLPRARMNSSVTSPPARDSGVSHASPPQMTERKPSFALAEPGPAHDKTHYKPKETKKNSRPKINKIAWDVADDKAPKKRKLLPVEYNFDNAYSDFQQFLGIATPRIDINKKYKLTLESSLEKYLFDFFVQRISVFIDTFLAHDYFRKIVSELALYDETRMILNSMFCLSSLIAQRMYPSTIDPLCPYQYYQKSVKSVGQNIALKKKDDPEGKLLARCLISTNLLCIYEMFFVAVDTVYVKGAGSILATILSKNKNEGLLRTSPFHGTCFWAAFVCDLILSLKLECANTFSIDKVWKNLDPVFADFDTYEAFAEEKTSLKNCKEDYSSFIVTGDKTTWWLQKIMLLFTRINEFLNSNDVITLEDYQSNKRFDRWVHLKVKLEEFEKNMPIYLKPLVYEPAKDVRQFPQIYFKDEKTAIVGINFRLAKLLLHGALSENMRIADTSLIESEMWNYPRKYRESLAKEVAGIMQTYDSDMKIWPVNIHALRQASKFIHPSSPCFQNLKSLTSEVVQFCQTRSDILSIMDNKQAFGN